MAAAKTAFDEIAERGWAIVPRASIGLPIEAVDDAHAALWAAADRLAYQRVGAFPAQPFREIVGSFDRPEWRDLGPDIFGGIGGFTALQFIPEQVRLQTHSAIEEFYRDLFLLDGRLLRGAGDHVFMRPDGVGGPIIEIDPRVPTNGAVAVVAPLFTTYAERANITLPGALQDVVGQRGALPHIDCNPWAADGYDATTSLVEGDEKVGDDNAERIVTAIRAEDRAPHMTRRWPIDRPYQSFIALTPCPGGPLAGGMGAATGVRDQWRRLRESPPHGKNPRWGNLVRVLPEPGGAWRDAAGGDDARAVDALHTDILGSIRFPAFEPGDMFIWAREATHRGCEHNFARAHQARVYVNKLPLNARNDDFMVYQAEQSLGGQQTHGKRRDKRERPVLALLTAYENAALGFGNAK